MEQLNPTLVTRKERKKIAAKSVFNHVIRAKLYGILTINSLEGIIHEVDQLIPQEALERKTGYSIITCRTAWRVLSAF